MEKARNFTTYWPQESGTALVVATTLFVPCQVETTLAILGTRLNADLYACSDKGDYASRMCMCLPADEPERRRHCNASAVCDYHGECLDKGGRKTSHFIVLLHARSVDDVHTTVAYITHISGGHTFSCIQHMIQMVRAQARESERETTILSSKARLAHPVAAAPAGLKRKTPSDTDSLSGTALLAAPAPVRLRSIVHSSH